MASKMAEQEQETTRTASRRLTFTDLAAAAMEAAREEVAREDAVDDAEAQGQIDHDTMAGLVLSNEANLSIVIGEVADTKRANEASFAAVSDKLDQLLALMEVQNAKHTQMEAKYAQLEAELAQRNERAPPRQEHSGPPTARGRDNTPLSQQTVFRLQQPPNPLHSSPMRPPNSMLGQLQRMEARRQGTGWGSDMDQTDMRAHAEAERSGHHAENRDFKQERMDSVRDYDKYAKRDLVRLFATDTKDIRFDGSSGGPMAAIEYLQRITEAVEQKELLWGSPVADAIKITMFAAGFLGSALTWWKSTKHEHPRAMVEAAFFRHMFEGEYVPDVFVKALRREFAKEQQRDYDNLGEYVTAFRTARLRLALLRVELTPDFLLNTFETGLQADVLTHLRTQRCDTLAQAEFAATQYYHARMASCPTSAFVPKATRSEPARAASARMLNALDGMEDYGFTCQLINGVETIHGPDGKQVICYYCGLSGHFKRDCRKRMADLKSGAPPPKAAGGATGPPRHVPRRQGARLAAAVADDMNPARLAAMGDDDSYLEEELEEELDSEDA